MTINKIIRDIEEKYLKECQEEGTFAEPYGKSLLCLNTGKYASFCRYRKPRPPEKGAGAFCERLLDYK